MRPSRFALAAALVATPLWADDNGFLGRTVQFTVETWDEPDTPFVEPTARVAIVGPGAEYRFQKLGRVGMDIVPVTIDVGRSRIHFDYTGVTPGYFATARFNGYVLTFLTDCVLIEGAALVPKGTTLPLDKTNLIVRPQSLSINVSGLPFGPEDRILLEVDVADCPLG